MQLGIDLGTHLVRAAYLDEQGRPQLVQLSDGSRAMPAAVRRTMHGWQMGATAAQALAGNRETTMLGCTRLMGRAGRLPTHLTERLSYPVHEVDGEAVCNLIYTEVRPGQVYGLLVRQMIEGAAQVLGQPIDEVVLTVPASAEDRFRVQARASVEQQGIRVRRLINQPAAALLAANLPATIRHVAIVHCGGGSTDVSLAERDDTGCRILATRGDMLLGGDDFAWAVAEQLNARFRQTAEVDVFAADRSGAAAQGLRVAAEEALQRLALAPEMTLTIDHGAGFGRDLVTVLQRPTLATWLQPLLTRVAELCRQALAAVQLRADQVEAVLLTGEWAFLPDLQLIIAHVFERPVADLQTDQAALLPVYGAALAATDQAGTIWDVTPYPLGINCYYNEVERFSPILTANTPIPTPAIGQPGAFIQSYQTRHRDQTSVSLSILQYRGLRDPNPYGRAPVSPNECELLGTWHFDGLRPKRGQHAAFTVAFAVDEDGILHLYARETATGHSLQAEVTRGIG